MTFEMSDKQRKIHGMNRFSDDIFAVSVNLPDSAHRNGLSSVSSYVCVIKR